MKPIARKGNIVVRNTANETLVYDLNINKALLLNETSAFIWKLCDGNHDISEIRRQVTQNFKQVAPEDLVWLACEQLNENNLLEEPIELPNYFRGWKRREMIKRIGFATMVSLPLITFIVAPKAINAASGACITDSNDCVDLGNSTQSNCCSGLRCISGGGFCLACRTSSSPPYTQLNSLTACQNSSSRNLCCNPTAPVTFTPANPPFSTVGSCFCG